MKLWILGRTSEADKVIDQLRSLYPTDVWTGFVRFEIFVFTGRTGAARAMLDSNAPGHGGPGETALWRTCLAALDHPSAATIAKARDACIQGVVTSANFAGQAVMIMSALGEFNTAFDIANGLLLSRGPIVPRDTAHGAELAHRHAMAVHSASSGVASRSALPRAVRRCRHHRILAQARGEAGLPARVRGASPATLKTWHGSAK